MLKSTPLEIKRAANQGTFTALASTYELDRQGDRILPGAFANTLQAWADRGGKIPLLWNHADSEPLGSIASATETDEGLQVDGVLELFTERGQQAHALLKAGGLSLSIGYQIPAGGASVVGAIREITQVDLVEVSLVAVPANAGATVQNVKHFSTPRDLEKALRDQLGLSNRQAKKLMSGGWQALSDESPDPIESIVLTQLKEIFE